MPLLPMPLAALPLPVAPLPLPMPFAAPLPLPLPLAALAASPAAPLVAAATAAAAGDAPPDAEVLPEFDELPLPELLPFKPALDLLSLQIVSFDSREAFRIDPDAVPPCARPWVAFCTFKRTSPSAVDRWTTFFEDCGPA